MDDTSTTEHPPMSPALREGRHPRGPNAGRHHAGLRTPREVTGPARDCFAQPPMVTWYAEVERFRLELYPMRPAGPADITAVAYRFWDLSPDWRARPVFTGPDWHPSVLHSVDGAESVRGLLVFLSLRPGDTDADYFVSYTSRQLAWRDARAEDLAPWALAPEETGDPVLVLDHHSPAVPLGRTRYAVVIHAASEPGGDGPRAPRTHGGVAEVVTSLSAAERAFAHWLTDTGHDHGVGDTAAWADLYRADDWDGTSYGDPLWRLNRTGPHGAITRQAY